MTIPRIPKAKITYRSKNDHVVTNMFSPQEWLVLKDTQQVEHNEMCCSDCQMPLRLHAGNERMRPHYEHVNKKIALLAGCSHTHKYRRLKHE